MRWWRSGRGERPGVCGQVMTSGVLRRRRLRYRACRAPLPADRTAPSSRKGGPSPRAAGCSQAVRQSRQRLGVRERKARSQPSQVCRGMTTVRGRAGASSSVPGRGGGRSTVRRCRTNLAGYLTGCGRSVVRARRMVSGCASRSSQVAVAGVRRSMSASESTSPGACRRRSERRATAACCSPGVSSRGCGSGRGGALGAVGGGTRRGVDTGRWSATDCLVTGDGAGAWCVSGAGAGAVT